MASLTEGPQQVHQPPLHLPPPLQLSSLAVTSKNGMSPSLFVYDSHDYVDADLAAFARSLISQACSEIVTATTQSITTTEATTTKTIDVSTTLFPTTTSTTTST